MRKGASDWTSLTWTPVTLNACPDAESRVEKTPVFVIVTGSFSIFCG